MKVQGISVTSEVSYCNRIKPRLVVTGGGEYLGGCCPATESVQAKTNGSGGWTRGNRHWNHNMLQTHFRRIQKLIRRFCLQSIGLLGPYSDLRCSYTLKSRPIKS